MKRLKLIKFLIFSVVLVFTFILRVHNYERVPTANHLDEQLYALSGINLIETGVPVSWSTLYYPKSAEVYKGIISYKGGAPSASVTLYKPWLDEPPLFSLLVGEAAHLFHADRSSFIPSTYIRFPVVLISTITSVVVFLIALEVSGFWIGILAMMIYGTEPIMVFASRSAMPETLIALFFALIVYLLLKFIKNQRLLYILPIPILAGLGGLSKPTGYFTLGLAIFVVFASLFKVKPFQWKKTLIYILYLVLGTIPFVLVYLWYGNHFSPEIFKSILLTQGFRPAGFNSLTWFFITPGYDTSILRSGWYIFCLVSAVFFIFKPKPKNAGLIILSFVYWIIIVMLSSGESDLLAWYRFPAFPYLAIMGAWGIQYVFGKADFFVTFLSVGLFLGSRMFLVNAFRPNVSANDFRIIFSSLMIPSLINLIFNKDWVKKIAQGVIVAVVVIGMWWNIKYIYNAYDIACENVICPMVPSIRLSQIHFPVIWRLFVLGK